MYVAFPAHREENDIEAFFDALSTIDAMDRKRMIGFAAACLGCASDYYPDAADESNEDLQLRAMRRRCERLINNGVINFFLTYALVVYICGNLRQSGDAEFGKSVVQNLKGAPKFFQSLAEAGGISQEMADENARIAQERINNIAGDTNLNRDRYHFFCKTVVRRLLPDIPGIDG